MGTITQTKKNDISQNLPFTHGVTERSFLLSLSLFLFVINKAAL